MILEILIAVLIVSLISVYITHVLGFFAIIPGSLMGLLLFAVAVDVVLFVIHRK